MRCSLLARRMAALLVAAALSGTSACSDRESLRIATTTSVDNSGMLQHLATAFERDTGVDLQVVAVGSGQAFALGRRGDVALLLTHEPQGERSLIDDGLVRSYAKVMFNRFVIAGPEGDPASLAGAASVSEAMQRLARSGAVFVSRGDASGTHVREQDLWRAAGARPAPARLVETGQGMAPTLRVASQRQAYVLTDQATLAQLSDRVALRALVTEGNELLNTYAVITLNTAASDSATLADRFAQWLAGDAGQQRIDAFRIRDRQVFFRWPPGTAASTPESQPLGAR